MRVVILHFQPLELYPPIQNLISVLSRKKEGHDITVITTYSAHRSLPDFICDDDCIHILKLGRSGMTLNALRRYFNYFKFNAGAMWYLIRKRPGRVLYFETISSLPAVLFKFINRACDILVHYHEYTTIGEYKTGMKLNRIFHTLEKRLYPRAAWVSHTNEFRLQKFLKDVEPVRVPRAAVLPNYPPRNWYVKPREDSPVPMRFVYVGSLSMETMYTRAFADWVNSQNGRVTWDIYSHNMASDAREFLAKNCSSWIHQFNGVQYSDLPGILKNYDVGVILYNGHIPNYKYIAPNKLFEYVACGLDVWFPSELIGSEHLVTHGMYPGIYSIAFSQLGHVNIESMTRATRVFKSLPFFCEDALEPLIQNLVGPVAKHPSTAQPI
jgi:hypothetical protein